MGFPVPLGIPFPRTSLIYSQQRLKTVHRLYCRIRNGWLRGESVYLVMTDCVVSCCPPLVPWNDEIADNSSLNPMWTGGRRFGRPTVFRDTERDDVLTWSVMLELVTVAQTVAEHKICTLYTPHSQYFLNCQYKTTHCHEERVLRNKLHDFSRDPVRKQLYTPAVIKCFWVSESVKQNVRYRFLLRDGILVDKNTDRRKWQQLQCSPTRRR